MIKSVIKSAVPMAALLLAMFPGIALAADGAALYKSKTCFKTPIMPGYPNIAGQNSDYALQQMIDIKSGARSNGQSAAMKGVMGLVSDEEMKALADYISTMAP